MTWDGFIEHLFGPLIYVLPKFIWAPKRRWICNMLFVIPPGMWDKPHHLKSYPSALEVEENIRTTLLASTDNNAETKHMQFSVEAEN